MIVRESTASAESATKSKSVDLAVIAHDDDDPPTRGRSC